MPSILWFLAWVWMFSWAAYALLILRFRSGALRPDGPGAVPELRGERCGQPSGDG